MANEENNLPAVQTEHLPDAARFAAEGVTDVLPSVAYQGIGSLAHSLTPEQEAVLDEPLPDNEVDIRPDGLVYASHEFYRRKLNKVFGRLGWTLVPGSPLKPRADKSDARRTEFYQRWILFVNGIYVSEAIASRTLWESNAQMTLDDVAEAIKSDALKRCCKDLGIATECWQRRWTKEWRDKFAIQVVVDTRDGRQNQWRRRDADALPREITTESKKTSGSAQPKPDGDKAETGQSHGDQETRTRADATAKTAPSAPDGQAVKGAPKAAQESDPPPTPPAQGAKRGAVLTVGQGNLVLARGRAAGLIAGDEPTLLLDILEREGIDLIETPEKTKMENAIAAIRQIGMADLKKILAAIDAAKIQEGAERI